MGEYSEEEMEMGRGSKLTEMTFAEVRTLR